MTVGNSSIISYLYITGINICLFKKIFHNEITNFLVIIILIIATITTVTTTAFIALFLIFIIYFFSVNYKKKIYIFFILIFLLFIWFHFFASFFNDSVFFEYLLSKLDQFIQLVTFSEKTKNIGTLDVRDDSLWICFKGMNYYEYFFGLGFNGYTKFVTYLENQYYVTFVNFGVTGLICFSVIIISFVKRLSYKLKIDYYLICVLVSLLLYSFTLEFFTVYTTVFCFAFSFFITTSTKKGNVII